MTDVQKEEESEGTPEQKPEDFQNTRRARRVSGRAAAPLPETQQATPSGASGASGADATLSRALNPRDLQHTPIRLTQTSRHQQRAKLQPRVKEY
ncbi:hypothetical protein EYF80_030396 [Liparis tanakae]|uniref:Uncharacterized protein n=1 Tax=Liparis tanakae TaxID=230148 RepID=A0A4Z2H1D2_9TELE|nr:hypothetical protein EYF80_030396 [Liparis tanakae]